MPPVYLPNPLVAPGKFVSRCRLLIVVLLALAACALARPAQAAIGTLLQDTIVDTQCMNFPAYSYSVPTVMGEAFQQDGVASYGGWEYATYYNSARHVCVGRRQLPDGDWETIELTDYYFASDDSHNDVVLGLCPADGTIHLSYDHHNNDLHYRVSVQGVITNPTLVSWDASLFPTHTTSQLIPGSVVSLVTYPCFITTPEGNLLFTVRYGSSGGGDQTLYTYDGTAHAWTKNGAFTIRTGSYSGNYTTNGTDRNAYVDWTYFDSTGRLHMTWCWRETPDALSNHDLNYAYSDDQGATWNNGAGALITTTGISPISIDSPGIIGWNIPEERGLINNSASCIDGQGIIHVMTWQLPDNQPDETTFSQSLSSAKVFFHYWRGTDNKWHRTATSLTGTRGKIVADDDGRLYLSYGDLTNVQVAMATRESGWTDWAALDLSGALPTDASSTVNTIIDYARWDTDRILSVYAQEINPNIPLPGATPLHVLDYHVSRLAVLPTPDNAGTADQDATTLSWTPGIEAVANDVYLGTSAAAVSAATTSSAEYVGEDTTGSYTPPAALSPVTTYYWRVDSVRADGTVLTGRVWSFTTPVAPPVITSATSAPGAVAIPFSYQITASNSPTSYDADDLPDGLNVDPSSGLISGTPTEEGVYPVTLFATNDGGTGTSTLNLTILALPVITSGSVAIAPAGVAFSYQITATNSPTSYGASGLPSGLSINPATGAISGSSTQLGSYSVTLSATNSIGTGTATLAVTIVRAPPVVSVTVITPQTTAGSATPAEALVTRAGGDPSQTLIVQYTVAGSAVNGTDYVLLSGQKKLKPGQLTRPIKIFGLGDLGGASKKTVKITLRPTNSYAVTSASSVKVKIVPGP